jgi:hypothetical protein
MPSQSNQYECFPLRLFAIIDIFIALDRNGRLAMMNI